MFCNYLYANFFELNLKIICYLCPERGAMSKKDFFVDIKCPNSLSAVLEEIFADIDSVDFAHVWRGQSNISSLPIPGIYRRLINNGYDESEINEDVVLA